MAREYSWRNIHRGTQLVEENFVSASDKAKDKLESAKGQAKKGAGRALDDPYLEGKGKAEQVKGDLKQAGEKVKDAVNK
jgi:uncharacterized protein YjbJ (UPF0337 family)